jgi:predicted transglutaminase-like cysteine proteinase
LAEGETALRWTIPILLASVLAATAPAHAADGGDPLSPIDSGTVTVTARTTTPIRPDIYGTVALNAGVTAYGARWRRVSAADEYDPRIRALGSAVSAARYDPVDRLALVNAEVAKRVQWTRDLDTYRIADYWAQAGETLTRGAGDSEDIAILKMQVLKAAGFPARDIYLSVGRDQARGADTMLLVRVGSDFYALDDRDPRPLLANGRRQFVPIITLGKNSAWLHGRRIVRASRAAPARVAMNRTLAR